jgi:hypothetical protein
MPSSRATARSDSPPAPDSASWRRASSLISLVSSVRARSRAVRPALAGGAASGAVMAVGSQSPRTVN